MVCRKTNEPLHDHVNQINIIMYNEFSYFFFFFFFYMLFLFATQDTDTIQMSTEILFFFFFFLQTSIDTYVRLMIFSIT